MTRVIGVHGVGNYRPGIPAEQAAEQLAGIWARHLTGNQPSAASPVDVRVAYYAAHLHRGGQQGDLGNLANLDPVQQAMILAWVTQLDAPQEIAQGRVTAPVRQAISWVADRFGLDHNLVERFVRIFFGEVHTYLYDPTSRQAARNEVADMFTAHAPQVVLAHSLGSVVAYEALWARPDLAVELLVTLGSPLGMPDVIFDRLDPAPADGWGRRPPRVRRWVNLADPGDLVAIPRHLAHRFADLDLDQEASIHRFDFHRVANYLACAAVRHQLAAFLV